MKLLSWLVCAVAPLSAAALLAQSPAPAATPEASPGATNSSELPAETQSVHSKKKPKFKEDHHFDPPATATVKDPLNVRGQPGIESEVVAHLHKGDTTAVLEAMTLRKPRKDEPARWARIALPSTASVWIFADYLDLKTMTVLPKKVNMRGGPGENYSVLGRLEKGATVKEVGKRNGWIRIETPPEAYGFVDADCLEMQTNAAPAAPVVAESPPVATPAPVPTPAPAPAPAPVAETAAAPAPPPAAPAAPPPIVAPEPVASTAPPPAAEIPAPTPKIIPRIISRDGVLHRAYNIQAPADYELCDGHSGEVIDYIQPQPKQDLKSYVGARVTVSGEEVLDHRWPRTPILELQTLDRAP